MRMRKNIGRWILTATVFSIVLSRGSYAVSTVENYEPYNDFFSMEIGVEEMGPGTSGPRTCAMATLGKGLTPFLSGYMGVSVAGNRYFSAGSGGFYLGTIASLYSYDRISFDATLETGLFDYYFYATPGIEVNYDLAPDQQYMGFYLNAGQQFTGRDTSWSQDDTTTSVDESSPKHVLAPETELKLGFYYSFIYGQQLHVRFDQRFRNNPLYEEQVYEIDALRVGYNMLIAAGLQIQTECNFRFPQYDDKSRFGLRIGLVKW